MNICANYTVDIPQAEHSSSDVHSVIISVLTIFMEIGNGLLALQVYMNRRTKVVKTTGMFTLLFLSFGVSLLSFSVLTATWLRSSVRCVVTKWFLYLGLSIINIAVALHAWRIAMVLDFRRLRHTHVDNTEIAKRSLRLLLPFVLILTVSTAFAMKKEDIVIKNGSLVCTTSVWDYLTYAGYFILICWGFVQCYRSRFAPSMYNFSTSCAMILYNSMGCLTALHVVMMLKSEENDRYVYNCALFVFSFAICAPAQGLIVLKQLLSLRNSPRDITVSVSDISGESQTHRLTVRINKHGMVLKLTCVPCGPMMLLNDDKFCSNHESPSHHDEDVTRSSKCKGQEVFKGYTEEEFDRLVDMFQNMKRENTILNRRLQNLCHQMTPEDDLTLGAGSTCGHSMSTDTLATMLTSTSLNYINSLENINSLTEETKDTCYSTGFDQIFVDNGQQRQWCRYPTYRDAFPMTHMPKSNTFMARTELQRTCQRSKQAFLNAIPERDSFPV